MRGLKFWGEMEVSSVGQAGITHLVIKGISLPLFKEMSQDLEEGVQVL